MAHEFNFISKESSFINHQGPSEYLKLFHSPRVVFMRARCRFYPHNVYIIRIRIIHSYKRDNLSTRWWCCWERILYIRYAVMMIIWMRERVRRHRTFNKYFIANQMDVTHKQTLLLNINLNPIYKFLFTYCFACVIILIKKLVFLNE